MADTRDGGRPNRGIRPRLGGILGRLTYVPSGSSERLGSLLLNRAKNETPYFQQVTPFKQWCPATRSPGYEFDGQPPWRIARSHSNWLLKTYPEALLADEDTEMLLAEEIANAAHSSPHPPAPESATLLATGEIVDVRKRFDAAVGVPALAMASGQSGQVLRLIVFDKEEWLWESEDVKVRLDTPNPRLTGEWTQDSLPITLIKFAVDLARYDPVRWLIVQKAASTTICEPHLGIVSTQYTEPSGQPSASSQIVANPLFTIRNDQTGNVAHSDAAFNPVFGQDPPQLIIIDQIGSWSVWDIIGRRSSWQKKLKPVMRMCGNIVKGILSSLPPPGAQIRQQHVALWLTLDRNTLKVREGSREPTPEAEESETERPQLLLMASTTAVSLVDTQSARWLSVGSVILNHPTQRVLDMKPSPLSPHQAFVLTSSMLFWVTSRETGSGKLTLEVLASCAHRRDGLNATLRLDVSPAAYLGGSKACFVCVRSVKNTQMTVVWFIHPQPNQPPQYHRTLVTLEGLASCVGLGMLPVTRMVGENSSDQSAGLLTAKSLKFFQMLALGEDYNLGGALCVWLGQPDVTIRPPDTLVQKNRIRAHERVQRRRFLRMLAEKFVVPDGYDERQSTRLIRLGQGETEPIEEDPTPVSKAMNMKAITLWVSGEGTSQQDPGRAWIEPEGVGLRSIGYAIQQRKTDGLMPRCSLLDLAGPGRTAEELVHLASEWESRQYDLMEEPGLTIMTPKRIFELELNAAIARYEKLYNNRKLEDGEQALVHRHRAIQRLVAEVILTEAGITVEEEHGPAATIVLESEREDHSEPQSSMSFRSSPPLPGLEEEPELPSLQPTSQVDDPVIRRLRQLGVNPEPRGAEKMVHFHWEVGETPTMVDWNPARSEDSEWAETRIRKKVERARKRAEKLASQGMSDGATSKAESQPLPIIVASQQDFSHFSNAGSSSQAWGGPSQPMSQIVPGAFGGRPKKKKKVKSGFR